MILISIVVFLVHQVIYIEPIYKHAVCKGFDGFDLRILPYEEKRRLLELSILSEGKY
jgi:hypothetical protein